MELQANVQSKKNQKVEPRANAQSKKNRKVELRVNAQSKKNQKGGQIPAISKQNAM